MHSSIQCFDSDGRCGQPKSRIHDGLICCIPQLYKRNTGWQVMNDGKLNAEEGTLLGIKLGMQRWMNAKVCGVANASRLRVVKIVKVVVPEP